LPKSVGGSPGRAEVRLVAVPGNPDHPFAFEPMELTVKAGTTVRWIDDGDVFHTVTSTDSHQVLKPNGLFDSSLAAKGAVFEYTFRKPGIYHYYCRPHVPFMVGTVRVIE
jgi:manganese oxidase